MAATSVVSGLVQSFIFATGSVSQASTSATVVVAGSQVDASAWVSVSYTASVITNDVKWSVWGANVSDYSDEVIVQAAANITTGSTASYTAAQAVFRYYRVKAIDNVGGTHGTITVTGVAKP